MLNTLRMHTCRFEYTRGTNISNVARQCSNITLAPGKRKISHNNMRIFLIFYHDSCNPWAAIRRVPVPPGRI